MIDPADLQAKSDQMNAVDFVKPMTFRVAKVEYFPRQEQPIRLHLEGYEGRPYKPCKSMLRGFVQVWGDDETMWVNRLIELYCDPTVKWAGKEAGGIRVSAVSGITEPFELIVQLNKKQRTLHTWNVIPEQQPVVKEFIATHFESDIAESKTNAEIDAIVKTVKLDFGEDALAQIKDAVIKARAALKDANENAQPDQGEPSASE